MWAFLLKVHIFWLNIIWYGITLFYQCDYNQIHLYQMWGSEDIPLRVMSTNQNVAARILTEIWRILWSVPKSVCYFQKYVPINRCSMYCPVWIDAYKRTVSFYWTNTKKENNSLWQYLIKLYGSDISNVTSLLIAFLVYKYFN